MLPAEVSLLARETTEELRWAGAGITIVRAFPQLSEFYGKRSAIPSCYGEAPGPAGFHRRTPAQMFLLCWLQNARCGGTRSSEVSEPLERSHLRLFTPIQHLTSFCSMQSCPWKELAARGARMLELNRFKITYPLRLEGYVTQGKFFHQTTSERRCHKSTCAERAASV